MQPGHFNKDDALFNSALGRSLNGQKRMWSGPATSYYGMPLVKKAHWEWQIVLYFFLGGIAGGSYLIATLADLLSAGKERALTRAGRYLSFVCILASPVFLIWDLGRPERFHHMLRVFKLRSVMSIGTWAISFFGMCCGLSTAHQMAQDGLLNWFPALARLIKALPIRLIDIAGSLFGLVVASYTGVLLSSTAVPVWARAKHILGPLFLTSGLSTALASLSFLLSFRRRNRQTIERLEGAEIVAMTTELGLISALVPVLGRLGKPVFRGRSGLLFNTGTVGSGLILPLFLRLFWKSTGKPLPRSLNIGASLLVLVGGMILRHVWIEAGRESADDPEAVHYYNELASRER
ncbi:MAG TPA: NrfD/PsrC family molybdoenzyme membrane anchor subunit [Ktedonobacteraceae bacterium]|nr:NrfD/PsrC family molybdoenzyme membrane anchor subunit [Ktedonobacteraceae bacterium]